MIQQYDVQMPGKCCCFQQSDFSPFPCTHGRIYFGIEGIDTKQKIFFNSGIDHFTLLRVATLNLAPESIPSEKYIFNPESTYLEQITVHLNH